MKVYLVYIKTRFKIRGPFVGHVREKMVLFSKFIAKLPIYIFLSRI